MKVTWCLLVLCAATVVPAWFASVELLSYGVYLTMFALVPWLLVAAFVQMVAAARDDRVLGLVVNSLFLGAIFWWPLLPVSLPLTLLAVLVLTLPQRPWVTWALLVAGLLLIATWWLHRAVEEEFLIVALMLPPHWQPRAHATLLTALAMVFEVERECRQRVASSRERCTR